MKDRSWVITLIVAFGIWAVMIVAILSRCSGQSYETKTITYPVIGIYLYPSSDELVALYDRGDGIIMCQSFEDDYIHYHRGETEIVGVYLEGSIKYDKPVRMYLYLNLSMEEDYNSYMADKVN